jgi:ribosome maturation factor RimP
MNSVEQKINDIILPTLNEKGYDIVRVQMRGKTKKTIQIMMERFDREPVAMDDCIEVNNSASLLLDLEDPVKDAYVLEVTSPGLDRPLVKHADYVRFQGGWIKLHTLQPIEGQQRFIGKLLMCDEEGIELSLKDSEDIMKILFDNIKKANLVPDYDIKDA